MPIKAVVFDAYGTLFDVDAAARQVARMPGGEALNAVWQKLSADWRAKQLQYSWLRAVTGDHIDFWQVTQDALDWAMEASDLKDGALRSLLLGLYERLEAYPEVAQMLAVLRQKGSETAILSNGSPAMLNAAITSAGIGAVLDATLSVEAVGVFKPHSSVYQLVPDHFSCARSEVLFVSSNGWDAAAAAGFGFETAWVNRAKQPMDRLSAKPNHILTDLTGIPDIIKP